MHRLTTTLAALALAATALSAPAQAVAPVRGVGSDCTVVGTPRADRLVGTAGDDVICGRGGDDVLRGLAGEDELRGGPGDDRLFGGVGLDQLDGGTGTDRVDGQAGSDRCRYRPEDDLRSCLFDLEAPELVELTVSADTVDVSEQSEDVVVRMHLTDDIGVTSVRSHLIADSPSSLIAQPAYQRVSGTARDGWWEATATIPRGFAPGPLELSASFSDVGGHRGGVSTDAGLTVVDSAPDLTLPTVQIVTPAVPTTVNVSTGPKVFHVEAHLVDVDTGVADDPVGIEGPTLCASRLTLAEEAPVTVDCQALTLQSGDVHDGLWSADLTIPVALPSGDLLLSAHVTDEAHPSSLARQCGDEEWAWGHYGPLRRWTAVQGATNADHLLRGSLSDTPPVQAGTTLDKSVVPAGETVTVSVDAEDLGVFGVSAVTAALVNADGVTLTLPLAMVEGDPSDGIWTWTGVRPSGLAAGQYRLVVMIRDRNHLRMFAGSTLQSEAGIDIGDLPGDPMVTFE